jgi:hypothetical protein
MPIYSSVVVTQTQDALSTAQAGYEQANDAFVQANTAYVQANSAYTQANVAVARPAIPNLNVITVNTTAVINEHYIFANATAGKTLTLPASPANGDFLFVTVASNTTNNQILRNGKKIMGLDEDMNLDSKYASSQLRYVNNTVGWIMY